MHKKEITKLEHTMKTKGLTCVLLKLYFKTNLVKAEICLVQGKKLFDKRQDEKDREIKRHLEREIKKW
jgi:SsrA-binding protein